MNTNQPIRTVDPSVLDLTPLSDAVSVMVVRMVPVSVATAAGMRRRTEVLLFDGAGADLHDDIDAEGHRLARDTVRAAFPGVVWDRAFDYHVASGRLAEVTALRVAPEPDRWPVAVMSLPEALADEPIPYVLTVAHERECALDEQRHQLSDPAEPPLAVASFAADVAAGHAETVGAWVARTGTERTAGGAA